MRRAPVVPRVDWRPGLRRYPYGVPAMGAGASWREDARYEFAPWQIDLIESVADELYALMRAAARQVVEDKLWSTLAFPPDAVRLMETSWQDH